MGQHTAQLLVATLVVFGLLAQTSCLHLSNQYNADFQNFEYFKYPYRGPGLPKPQASFTQKAKAVAIYVKEVLLGHPLQQNTYHVPFDPERGSKLHPAYRRQFGYRGENLIALIGNGYSPEALRHYGAIGKNFGKY